MSTRRKTVSFEEILSTFSTHVRETLRSPVNYRENLEVLLGEKKERMDVAAYIESLERNVVYLDELVCRAEELLDRLLKKRPAGLGDEAALTAAVQEIEENVRTEVEELREDIFSSRGSDEFKELRGLRKQGGEAYIERIEFHYGYLMTLRILFFEFLGVLAAVNSRYDLPETGEREYKQIETHVELTAHFYMGNIDVESCETEGNSAS